VGRQPASIYRIYRELIAEGHIVHRAKKMHTKLTRKKRTPVTPEIFEKVKQLYLRHTSAVPTEIAKLSGLSFKACYNIHDKLVLAGVITTRRLIKTCYAHRTPLKPEHSRDYAYTYKITRPNGELIVARGKTQLYNISISEGLHKTTLHNIYRGITIHSPYRVVV